MVAGGGAGSDVVAREERQHYLCALEGLQGGVGDGGGPVASGEFCRRLHMRPRSGGQRARNVVDLERIRAVGPCSGCRGHIVLSVEFLGHSHVGARYGISALSVGDLSGELAGGVGLKVDGYHVGVGCDGPRPGIHIAVGCAELARKRDLVAYLVALDLSREQGSVAKQGVAGVKP